MYNTDSFDTFLRTNHERFMDDFAQFINIPSVAADGRGIQPMADLLSERFRKLGATVVRQYPLPGGSPVVYAEFDGASDATMLIYNHYDVQPEDPRDLWESEPFQLTRKDGMLFGRGVCDDKGDLSARLHAVEAWLATQGRLPCKIKWVVEGEEEIGSINLPAWAEQVHDMLTADGVLWEGGGYDALGRPAMAAGCKGICYIELHADGPAVDVHSGYAPIVPNPAWRLVQALATMKDANDQITIDGYMDQIAPVSAELRAALDALPDDDLPERQQAWKLTEWRGGVTTREAFTRLYTEPTVTISGIHSGYGGAGPKTVLPAHAYAKVDCRLVPNLTYGVALKLIRDHLDRRGFTDIEIKLLGGEEPADSPVDSRITRAAVKASQQVWGKTPLVFPRFAGSGPMYPLSTMINVPTISCGAIAHPNAQVHSPNENIYEKDYVDAMKLFAALIDNFSADE